MIAQLARDLADPSLSPEKLRSTWNEGMARIAKGRTAGMFGGMEETQVLIDNLLMQGERAIDFLKEMACDEQETEEDRELALDTLSRICRKSAFDAVMASFENAPSTPIRDRCHAVRFHAATLSTADLRTSMGTLDRWLEEATRQQEYDADTLLVAASLAFQHGDATAKRLLDGAAAHPETVSHLLSAADAVHDDDAQRFVRTLAGRLPLGPDRAAAEQALADW